MAYTPRQAAKMVDKQPRKFAADVKRYGASMMKKPRIRLGHKGR